MPEWPASLRIGLSLTGVSALRVSTWRKPHASLLKDMQFVVEAKTQEQLHERLAIAFIDLPAGAAAHVVLADEWVRYFTVTPPGNVGRLSDLQAVAALRFQDLYENSPADWHIEASWSASWPFLACAIPRWLLAVLEQEAASRSLYVTGIEPQFISAWNQYGAKVRPDGWFGVLHKRRLTCCPLQVGYPVESHTIMLPEHAQEDAFWIGEQLRRAALMRGMAPPPALYLCGVVPAPWMNAAANQFQITALERSVPDTTLATESVVLALQEYSR